LFAVVNSIIAVYYYLKVIIVMYSQPANDKPLVVHPTYMIVAIICAAATIGLTIAPNMFMQILK
jgi:NADH-quinone oxidoreductase subunit N